MPVKLKIIISLSLSNLDLNEMYYYFVITKSIHDHRLIKEILFTCMIILFIIIDHVEKTIVNSDEKNYLKKSQLIQLNLIHNIILLVL